mgnify:CR=1 FL=1
MNGEEKPMIKIERKETEKTNRRLTELQKPVKWSSYNIESVNQALKEIFHGKCYICENKAVTSYQIEHLVPHRGDKTLKYDWKNLFWSCAHCNNIKSDKYEPILDCTKEPVEKMIAFRKRGYFGTDEKLEFTSVGEEREDVKNTIALLEAAYYGTTPQKEDRSTDHKEKTLRQKSFKFLKEYVREYQETEDKEEKEDIGYLLKKELRDSAAFCCI